MKVYYFFKIPNTHGRVTEAYFYADFVRRETKSRIQFQSGEKIISIKKTDLITIEFEKPATH